MMVQTDVKKMQQVLGRVLKIHVMLDHAIQDIGRQQRQHALERLDKPHRAQACAMGAAPADLRIVRGCDSAHV